jgi:hypothetical protein
VTEVLFLNATSRGERTLSFDEYAVTKNIELDRERVKDMIR